MIFGKQKRRKIEHLKTSFGKIKKEAFGFEQIRKYHDRKDHTDCFQLISEKTCQDLDFEELFQFLDRTTSKTGQQYLFSRLRCISNKSSELGVLEQLVERFQIDQKARLKAQKLLTSLNDQDAYFIPNLFQLPNLVRPNWFFVVPLLSITNVLAVLLSFILPQYLFLVFGITLVNLVIHYWNKWNLFDYLTSIPQLLRLYQVAKALLNDEQEEAYKPLKKAIRQMDGVKKRMFLFKMESGVQDDMKAGLSGLFELVKIVFLLDPLALFGALKQIEDKKDEIQKIFEYVGRIDTAISIASLRDGLSTYCIPEVVDAKKSLIANGCVHPLIPDGVPNSISLKDESLLLTGSNMSGKTTFIRTIGINVLTALTIHTCFAEYFSLPRLRLWSAIRMSDDLMNDRSYYFEEVLTIKEMISHSEDEHPNLFLLDELYKGTNTIERISGGKAVLSHLNQGDNLVLVSTHDLELTHLLKDEFKLNHFTEQVNNRDIRFDYQLKEGPLTTRNAIKILEANDYPQTVVAEANSLANLISEVNPAQLQKESNL